MVNLSMQNLTPLEVLLEAKKGSRLRKDHYQRNLPG